ncbi:hypothetical protein FACS189441_5400 [Betaproteobacteria bacterium]|nr:hypothetical protein FACS189441_5400 [Betaproteobacteria bacterium]
MFTTIISAIWSQLSGVHILLAAICLTLMVFKTTREGVTGKPRYHRGKRGEGYISGVSRKDWDDYSNWKKEQKQKEIDFIVNGSGKNDHGGHIWATLPETPSWVAEHRERDKKDWEAWLSSEEYKRQEERVRYYQELDKVKEQQPERDLFDYDDDEMMEWARNQERQE